MSDYYEPWQPQVGQRVRVRLSGECRECADWLEGDGDRQWRGEIARVEFVVHRGHESAHRFHVTSERDSMMWSLFAAIELEPVDE